jgi:Protein of unknown function (DUF732)
MNGRPAKWSMVCAVLLSAALLCAAPASADPTDDAFVAALAKEGIAVADRNSTIAMAHTVCAGFDKNNKSSILAMKLMNGELALPRARLCGVKTSKRCLAR